jgi:hypothetical protein
VGVAQLIAFMKEAGKKVLVIVLAVILVLLVASRNVEYELEQEALQAQEQVEGGQVFP